MYSLAIRAPFHAVSRAIPDLFRVWSGERAISNCAIVERILFPGSDFSGIVFRFTYCLIISRGRLAGNPGLAFLAM